MDSRNGSNANSYEEERRKRLEDNKRRMEELNLTALASSLTETTNTAKPARTPQRRFTPRAEGQYVAVRRSSRVANLPSPDYREPSFEIPYFRRSYGRRSLLSRTYASNVAREGAIERALQIESDLGSTYATFVKPMLQSHVTGGFWLGLPSHFCKSHMPKKDTRMILEDENGEDSETLYLAGKVGLSAGWRGFSIDHGLVDGDCLVFQLIPPSRFKVYIVRSADFESGRDASEKNSENEADASEENKDNETDASEDSENEADANVELSKTSKRKISSKDDKKVSNESLKADGRLLKKSKKLPKTLGEAEDGKQQSKKAGEKPSENSDGIEHGKQQNGSSAKDNIDANEGHNSKVKEESKNRVVKGTKSKMAKVKSGGTKKINNIMPSRKTKSETHLKSNGRIVMVVA